MKITYRHLIKILSCSVVICTIVLCSIFVPAYAAAVVLKPIDYANGMSPTTEGTMLYSFRFKSTPYFECFNGSTLALQTSGSLEWYPVGGNDFYRISISPLGNTLYNGTVIDVSDFKTGAVLDVAFSALLELDLKSEGSSGLTYIARSQMLLYWFDKDMNLIKTENCGTVEKSFTHGEADAWLLQNSYDMSILDDAAYVSPRFITQIYKPDAGDILRVRSAENIFLDVVVEKDDVNADSLLLENIEKQLDDLNDKADELINGTPEQNQAAQDAQNKVDSFQSEVNGSQELEKEWLEDFDESSDILNDNITGFVDGKGFTQLSALVSPIMTWASTGVIMMLLIAFINMSIILFGR